MDSDLLVALVLGLVISHFSIYFAVLNAIRESQRRPAKPRTPAEP